MTRFELYSHQDRIGIFAIDVLQGGCHFVGVSWDDAVVVGCAQEERGRVNALLDVVKG